LLGFLLPKEKRHPISEVALASFRCIHAARPGAGLGFHSDLLTVLAQTHNQINCMGLYVVSDKSGISVGYFLHGFSIWQAKPLLRTHYVQATKKAYEQS